MDQSSINFSLMNKNLILNAILESGKPNIKLIDQETGFYFADGEFFVKAAWRLNQFQMIQMDRLVNPSITQNERTIYLTGQIGELIIDVSFSLAVDEPYLTEKIEIANLSGEPVHLVDFACGLTRKFTDRIGHPLPELANDRFQAVPFLHRPTDPTGKDNDLGVNDILEKSGQEIRLGKNPVFIENQGWFPTNVHHSEGWVWRHEDISLGIFKFNQDAIEFSLLGIETYQDAVWLRFGGCGLFNGEPSAILFIEPGKRIKMGETRYHDLRGDYTQASYAFRALLDEKGSRFPLSFDPPVHWNELYDNPEWNLGSPGHPSNCSPVHTPLNTRHKTYTRKLLFLEAEKARMYSCESLYLDPGWDTSFGTFIWGDEWLGNCQDFITKVSQEFGLKVSLHCPLATWMSFDGRSIEHWPNEAQRMDKEGRTIANSLCLGAKQYLDEATRRLLNLCRQGVSFLMFDGNWYNDGCWNPSHGHPIPYTYEDHCLANLELARRIHEQFPDVLIEMHDMISGGSILRYTPIYYKYGLPGSYDENWGFELMWQPMEDILSGRARSLYYYNLASNIPAYLHIDLRDDNEHCLVFWWYASTCRHLGIGGTHENPQVAQAQQLAMQRYRKLERFFKRGIFYGLGEEIHFHVLPAESSFVINLFNLSSKEKVITGEVRIDSIGINPDQWFILPKSTWFDPGQKTIHFNRRLTAWSTQVIKVVPLDRLET